MKDIKLLYIDLFCGAGGTSTGVEKASYKNSKCAKVVACVNHNTNAIASHAANHPGALHFTEDIRALELSPLIDHISKMKEQYPLALIVLWASLECTNFSKAKRGQPRDADSRTLAEHLFRYVEAINPDYIQIENVEEFMSWGDLDENGKPVSKHFGQLFNKWVHDMKFFGNNDVSSGESIYTFQYRILNAADYGAYTSRKRFFGIFAKGNLPIAFPEPAYSKTGGKNLFDTLGKWKPVKDVLDFSDEGESIFTRKKPLSDKTLERIYAGLIKFVAGGKDKWLLKYNSVNGLTGKHVPPSIDAPCPTVSCQGRLGIVQTKFLSKYYSGHPQSKNFSVEEPAHTITPIDHHALINASFIQQRNSGTPKHKVISVERPARTITTTAGNQELVQSAFLGRYNGQLNQKVNAVSVEAPSPMLTVKDRLAKIQPKYLCSYNFKDNTKDINSPCPTLLTKDRYSLVSPRFIVNEYSGGGQQSSIDDVCPAVLTNPKQKIVSCEFWLMNTNFSNTGSSITEPSQTITANRKWHYLMNPQFYSAGSSINNPCFTLIARMDKMPPYLVTAKTVQIAIEVYETDSEPMRRIKKFMAIYGIADIKMRMLKIPELKRIMGFPEDYKLIGTQADQKKFIGNAVEVNMAKVLCEALVEKLKK
ncbi:DNA (cytosine-5)-methyltransferase 1 [termite gut metagenome]|uniref:DNA (cytosine-5-)-methyltransferase n=1 Tax=termite gut metagenome TaxID=433724 RepID=A0A5J4RU11_9ZZZZ